MEASEKEEEEEGDAAADPEDDDEITRGAINPPMGLVKGAVVFGPFVSLMPFGAFGIVGIDGDVEAWSELELLTIWEEALNE